jgi:hypothetical protein
VIVKNKKHQSPRHLAQEASDLDEYVSCVYRKWGKEVRWVKLPEDKYNLDAALLDSDGSILAWLEHKTSTSYAHQILHARKANEGVELARTSKIPFILLTRKGEGSVKDGTWKNGQLMMCSIFDIRSRTNWQNTLHDPLVKLFWQVDGRKDHNNPADKGEPAFHIPWVLFKEMK